ncbi:MAG: tetratricopeptide repeat protein [Spirochaetales bacterium]|nr:tetratricopeptide repeat protein [Spirochaetales bacterium]
MISSCQTPEVATFQPTPQSSDQVPEPAAQDTIVQDPATPGPNAQELGDLFEQAIVAGDIGQALEIYFLYLDAQDREGLDSSALRQVYPSLLLSAGHIEEAEEYLRSELKNNPRNIDVLYGLSLIASAENDRPQLESLYSQMIEIDSEDSRALTGLGMLARTARQNSQAREFFRRALESDPQNLQALLARADLLFSEGSLEAAAIDLSRALVLDPNIDFAWALRGRIRAADGDLVGGLEDLDRAIEVNPYSPWNFVDRGRTALRAGRVEQAAGDFSAAWELDDSNFLTLVYRAQAYDSLGDSRAAAEDYRQVLSMRPDYNPAYISAAVSFFQTRNYAEAQRYFVAGAQTQGARPEYYLLAALAGYYNDQRAATNRSLSDWLSRIPQDSIFRAIGRYYTTPGNESTLLFQIQRITDVTEKAQAQVLLGAHILLEGRTATALALLSEMGEDVLRGLPEGAIARWLTNEYIK